MPTFPTSNQLAATADALRSIEPETRAQEQALSDAVQLLQALSQSPAIAKTLAEQMAGMCETLNQSARERTNAVIAGRLHTLNTQVMGQFDQGQSNPSLLAAYLVFARATHRAFSIAPIDPREDDASREAHSQERFDAFDVAETTVRAVRQALVQPMTRRLQRGSPLRQLAAEYADLERSTQAFLEHLSAATHAVEEMAPAPATTLPVRNRKMG